MTSALPPSSPPSERSREILAFLLVGGFSAAVNFGSGEIVRQLAPALPNHISVGVGFAAGTVASFILNRRVTFKVADQALGPQAVRFLALSTASLLIGAAVADGVATLEPWVLPDALLRTMPHTFIGKIAHFGSIGVMTVFNYFGMKLFAMRRVKVSG